MVAPALTSGLTREAAPLGVATFTYPLRAPRGEVATAPVATPLSLVAPAMIFRDRIGAKLTQWAVKE